MDFNTSRLLDQLGSQFPIQCPWCEQVFTAVKKDIVARETKYVCTSCKKRFQLTFKEGTGSVAAPLRGEPIPVSFSYSDPALVETDRDLTKICFKCAKEVPGFLNKCFFCGAEFVKILRGRASEVLLAALWKGVLSNWEDNEKHADFMLKCYQQKQVRFGLRCYGAILKQSADNEKAHQMIQMAQNLSFFFEKNPKVQMSRWFLTKNRLSEYVRMTSPFLKTYGMDLLIGMVLVLLFSWFFISL